MVHKTPGWNRRAVWLAVDSRVRRPAASAQDDLVLERAYTTSPDTTPGNLRDIRLRSSRCGEPDAEQGRILAMLPADGNKHDLNTAQLKKLAAVRRYSNCTDAKRSTIIRIIEVPQAAVALHARAVVLVSERALDLLDADELQALVAHEIGHEYFWGEYLPGSSGHAVSRLCGHWNCSATASPSSHSRTPE